ncbi:hypothetical protein HMPREF9318_00099 [Streptococcus urinalis FB127-CNA-2]|uniref:Phage tail protein n=1 Tax=Streptococcus urinalis 2285-97 TaxID=764291 RepID=G5KEK4_9STRE|nr:phage tail domain-containing protein [Streptococcus urinalis]QBX22162.1 capsid and scaffold protein [Streptococcus phage Javan637]QBX31618.1 capsid and scaffold protein [Streptococcus phage Javan642]QBX31637.1 capsid and scaffold protein [Streptococcus phage Javan648]EHJ56432.1 phage tail protein [Streptococcus urinalis 2285-97]EKS21901.1 hypothetical protein HMPREF9318_00099 [Streptococcus urinalis FB127-CNA-2]
MGIELTYDGININDEIDKIPGGRFYINDVPPVNNSTISNTYLDQGINRYGQQLLYSNYNIATLSVSFKMTGTIDYFYQVSNTINSLLSTRNAKKLTFSHFSNISWEAIQNSKVSPIIDYSTSPFTASGTISFEIPKIYGERDDYSEVTTEQNGKFGEIVQISPNHFKATLNNYGSAETNPIVTITHHSENGYIGLVGADSIVEIGNKGEQDVTPDQKSERLLDFRGNDGFKAGFEKATFNQGTNVSMNESNFNGNIGIQNWNGRQSITIDRSTTAFGGSDLRGSLTWDIPADTEGNKGSLHDYIWWRQIYVLGLMSQAGGLKVVVTDENDKFLYGVETLKLGDGMSVNYNCFGSYADGSYKLLKSFKFEANESDYHNPFNSSRGWSDIVREDENLSFYWFGSRYERVCPEIKGRKSAKVHLIIEARGNRPRATLMFFQEFLYQKNKVEFMRDIPNRFGTGSQVIIDNEKGKIVISNIEDFSPLVPGSEFFSIPTGTSEIHFFTSDWVTSPPTISFKWKERII